MGLGELPGILGDVVWAYVIHGPKPHSTYQRHNIPGGHIPSGPAALVAGLSGHSHQGICCPCWPIRFSPCVDCLPTTASLFPWSG